MALRHWTTGQCHQHCFVLAAQRSSPVFLHLILENAGHPSHSVTRPHVTHGGLTHPIYLCNLLDAPPLRTLKQNMPSHDTSCIGFTPPDKSLDLHTFCFAQF